MLPVSWCCLNASLTLPDLLTWSLRLTGLFVGDRGDLASAGLLWIGDFSSSVLMLIGWMREEGLWNSLLPAEVISGRTFP